VVYWGHVTRNEQFSSHKVSKFWAGGNPAAQVETCTNHCSYGSWGDALNSLDGVAELQRLSFASKIVTFVDPDNAGVFDNRINRFLVESCLDKEFLGVDGGVPYDAGGMRDPTVALPANRRRYQNWCLRLQELAHALNARGTAGFWTCTERSAQPWRAVDVERAIFAIAERRPQSPTRTSPSHSTGFRLDALEFVELLKAFLGQNPLRVADL
jgi:hypothetical protein